MVGTCSSGSDSSSSTFRKCACDDGYTAYDCSLRTCPKGKAWWDDPSATDTAHGWAECAGRGTCDRSTGKCKCDSGSTGAACDRTECPYVSSTDATVECNGKGRCMNIKTLNTYREENGVDSALVYGSDLGAIETWDANLFQACLCDNNRYLNNQYSWTGTDCAFRTCPRGDDPETATTASGYYQKEIQKITCVATGGSFTLKFRDLTTVAIPYNANANGTNTTMSGTGTVTYGSATLVTTVDLSALFVAGDFVIIEHVTDSSMIRQFTVASDSSSTVVMTEPIGMTSAGLYTIYKVTTSIESALEALNTIDDVTVTIESGSSICTATGGVDPRACLFEFSLFLFSLFLCFYIYYKKYFFTYIFRLLFISSFGNPIVVLLFCSAIEITFETEHGNVPTLIMASSLTGTNAALTLVNSQPGTTESVECSNHGKCDATTGLCKCDDGWTSSDGDGKYGTKGDCGSLISSASCQSQFCASTIRL